MSKYYKPVIDLVATGSNIRKLRLENGISVRTLQSIFNFSYPQAIYNWEHGVDVPKIDNLIVLAQIYGVSIDEIIVTKKIEIEVKTDSKVAFLESA